MSFYSYIKIFYPGRPPLIDLGSLRVVCDSLRDAFALEDDTFKVSVCYNDSTNQLPGVTWDQTGTIGTNQQNLWSSRPWDYEKESLTWEHTWPDASFDARSISRANIHLGNLSDLTIKELGASDDERSSPTYISPTKMSILIRPVWLGTLTGELPENECYGGLALSFSGYGYFTWQPLDSYWATVRQSTSMQKALQMCKEMFPAPRQLDITTLKERLGEMFLNHEEYQPGDWIVSVSESG